MNRNWRQLQIALYGYMNLQLRYVLISSLLSFSIDILHLSDLLLTYFKRYLMNID
jgi:hypothetical protein